jgi:hypothetical protein
MMRSDIDKRANRDCPRQCMSDYGMHKDAPPKKVKTKTPTALKAELEKWLAATMTEVRP